MTLEWILSANTGPPTPCREAEPLLLSYTGLTESESEFKSESEVPAWQYELQEPLTISK